MAQSYCSRTRTMGLVTALILSAAFVFLGEELVSLYNKDASIVETGGKIMFFVAFMQPFQASQFIVAGGLRGAGDTKATARITLITVLIMRPILTLLFVYLGMGLYGAWLAFAMDQLVRTGMVLARYNSGKWKLLKLKNDKGVQA